MQYLLSNAIRLVWVAVALSVIGCGDEPPTSGSQQASKRIAVAAASDLRFAFDKLVADFEVQNPEFEVEVTYGSSGNFFTQLSNKAPFDIYFSADIAYSRRLVAAGLADANSEFLYAVGQIVIWVPNDSPINIESLNSSTAGPVRCLI